MSLETRRAENRAAAAQRAEEANKSAESAAKNALKGAAQQKTPPKFPNKPADDVAKKLGIHNPNNDVPGDPKKLSDPNDPKKGPSGSGTQFKNASDNTLNQILNRTALTTPPPTPPPAGHGQTPHQAPNSPRPGQEPVAHHNQQQKPGAEPPKAPDVTKTPAADSPKAPSPGRTVGHEASRHSGNGQSQNGQSRQPAEQTRGNQPQAPQSPDGGKVAAGQVPPADSKLAQPRQEPVVPQKPGIPAQSENPNTPKASLSQAPQAHAVAPLTPATPNQTVVKGKNGDCIAFGGNPDTPDAKESATKAQFGLITGSHQSGFDPQVSQQASRQSVAQFVKPGAKFDFNKLGQKGLKDGGEKEQQCRLGSLRGSYHRVHA